MKVLSLFFVLIGITYGTLSNGTDEITEEIKESLLENLNLLLTEKDASENDDELKRITKAESSYEDDMIVSTDESQHLKRSLVLNFRHWPADGRGVIRIPYVIKEYQNGDSIKFLPFEILTIEIAVASINGAINCEIKPWVPRTDEKEYIEFRKSSSKCQSYVGKVTSRRGFNGVQPIDLNEKDCLKKPGAIIHEMMHAMGFLHEHTRPDRDDYVTINEANIENGAKGNFQKVPEQITMKSKTKYDYLSIMHYKKTALSRYTGLITIKTKDPKYQDVIGQRRFISKMDQVALNEYFNCPGMTDFFIFGEEFFITRICL